MKNASIESFGTPNPQELELINKFTRRNLSADEVYIFNVVLCDNDIDRDFDKFSTQSLSDLAKMYVGKSGIFDHSGKGSDQSARIFDCVVESVDSKTTTDNEKYCRLKAKAYMPKTAKNSDLIAEIDAGIKKEVSVGCAVGETICSICGNDAKSCNHIKGRYYRKGSQKKLCFNVLNNPTDAYEWSFVAVPAQKEAGVVKSFGLKGEQSLEFNEILKNMSLGQEVSLNSAESISFAKQIMGLKEIVAKADELLNLHKAKVIKQFAAELSQKNAEILGGVVERMNATEVFKLLEQNEKGEENLCPQLAPKNKSNNSNSQINSTFIV